MEPDGSPPARPAHGRRSGAVRELSVSVDRALGMPLRRQLEASLRDAVRAGRLRSGTLLPSSRELARQLGVSRGVVVDAYQALTAQGFLQARDRAASTVASLLAQHTETEAEAGAMAAGKSRFDFTATTPDVSLFDRRAWVRAVDHVLRTMPNAALGYPDPAGCPALRDNLADYLGRVRAVAASAGQLLVTAGYSQAIDLTCRVLAASGARRVAFEEFSHDEQWEAARRAGLGLVPVPVDADGIRVGELARADPDAVVVTPAHQFPTGAVLESSRRRALLAWAAQRNALVIEDDYDSEFRYDRAPAGTLQGLDPTQVLYAGTASKTLAPALRLGWIVVPQPLRGHFADAKRYADAGSPAVEQLALARLLATGDYERAVHKARRAYRRRRDTLLAATREYLPGCQVQGIAAGLHVLLHLPPGTDDTAAVTAARERGLALRPLSDFRLTPGRPSPPALLLGYGRLPEPAITPAVRELAAAIHASRPPR
jgi:GntR family transcriptional regulator / MocR family aminotransferase